MLNRSLYFVVLISILALVIGCDNFENPVGTFDFEGLNKNRSDSLNFISLPDPGALFKPVETSATISPRSGGRLHLNYSQGRGADRVQVQVSLQFQPGSVTEDVRATMSVDVDKLVFDFEPAGTKFLKPGSLSVNASGLDLSHVPEGAEIKLFFVNDNGEWEEMNARQIRYDVSKGVLHCVHGDVPHFSRYAFAF